MSRGGFRLIDAVVCFALFLGLSGFYVFADNAMNETNMRRRCASNLMQIGQALLLYSNENNGWYPRTVFQKGDNPKPVWGTPYEGNKNLGSKADADPFRAANNEARPQPNDVTAAFYLLMRTEEITNEVYLCPSTMRSHWDFGGGMNTALNWTNWAGNAGIRDHLSYSYQNPYPSNKAVKAKFRLNSSLPEKFAVAADMNPGTAALLKLTANSDPKAMRDGNSFNHNQDGQNVLFGDGHVDFTDNPFVGVKGDNIYTHMPAGADIKDDDGIVGSPGDANDSILLPTARDIGMLDDKGQPRADMMPTIPTPADIERIRKSIVGSYSQDGNPAKLTISNDRIVTSGGAQDTGNIYKIDSQMGNRLNIELVLPMEQSMPIDLSIDSDGVTINGNPFYMGHWKRN